jgi:hypothetical protein
MALSYLDIHIHVTALEYTLTSSKKGTYEASHHDVFFPYRKYLLRIAQF